MKVFLQYFVSMFVLSLCFACGITNKEMAATVPATSTISSPAVILAQEQLDAYNKRDITAFLKPYSDTVKVYNERTFNYQGIENMRTGYTDWFDSLDSLHCQVVNRISSGNTVIDHERLTFRRKGAATSTTFEAIAVYKVWDGKIQEVMFIQPAFE